MSKIVINVSAKAGVGKSTVANHIANVLFVAGFKNIEFIDIDGKMPVAQTAMRLSNLSTRNDIEIVVQTEQLHRTAL